MIQAMLSMFVSTVGEKGFRRAKMQWLGSTRSTKGTNEGVSNKPKKVKEERRQPDRAGPSNAGNERRAVASCGSQPKGGGRSEAHPQSKSTTAPQPPGAGRKQPDEGQRGAVADSHSWVEVVRKKPASKWELRKDDWAHTLLQYDELDAAMDKVEKLEAVVFATSTEIAKEALNVAMGAPAELKTLRPAIVQVAASEPPWGATAFSLHGRTTTGPATRGCFV